MRLFHQIGQNSPFQHLTSQRYRYLLDKKPRGNTNYMVMSLTKVEERQSALEAKTFSSEISFDICQNLLNKKVQTKIQVQTAIRGIGNSLYTDTRKLLHPNSFRVHCSRVRRNTGERRHLLSRWKSPQRTHIACEIQTTYTGKWIKSSESSGTENCELCRLRSELQLIRKTMIVTMKMEGNAGRSRKNLRHLRKRWTLRYNPDRPGK